MNLFQELKRRKVLTTLGVYGAAAFVIIQVAGVVFPALRFPDWTVAFVIILIILGFPITFFLSWTYDLKRETDDKLGRLAQNVPLGGSWITNNDSLKFYVNMGSPPSRWWSTGTWNLKKVKDKKGIKIAHIDVIDEITADLNITVDFLGERQVIAGNASGKSDAKIRWDVENTGILYSRTVSSLKGSFEMDGEIFTSTFYFRQTTKRVK